MRRTLDWRCGSSHSTSGSKPSRSSSWEKRSRAARSMPSTAVKRSARGGLALIGMFVREATSPQSIATTKVPTTTAQAISIASARHVPDAVRRPEQAHDDLPPLERVTEFGAADRVSYGARMPLRALTHLGRLRRARRHEGLAAQRARLQPVFRAL